MTRLLSALLLALPLFATPLATLAEPPAITASAPDRHIVVPGDTLWGIAGKFLQQPWRWPELWRLNREQIANPHLIYPGDVIALVQGADGNPQLRVVGRQILSPKTYSEKITQAIPSIPAKAIEPFLSEPLIVDINGLDQQPVIVAAGQDRVMMGNGDVAYVSNVDEYEQQEQWQVYRPGKPLPDPETGNILGYEAFYLGTAKQLQAGEPAVFEIVSVKQEIARGDRLVPAAKPALLNYVPHTPQVDVDARIASVYGGVNEGGRFSVVTINRGHNDGLEIGHVLSLSRNRVVPYRKNGKREQLALPEERYGLLFVFRTFDNVAYALVMNSKSSVAINDFVRNP